MLGVSCNEEMTREKSVRKEVRCERTQGQLGVEKLSQSNVAQTKALQGLVKY